MQEQPPQAGPVGSATSLARWKRDQRSQTKIVECPVPSSTTDIKAVVEKAPSDVDTNCGASSIDQASNESQSRPASRASLAGNEYADDMKLGHLRLLMGKACVQAAQSGDLAVALQQVQSVGAGAPPKNIMAPPGKPTTRRPSRKTAPSSDQKTKEDEMESIKMKVKEVLISCATDGGLDKLLPKSGNSTSRPVEEAKGSEIDSVRQRALSALVKAASSGSLDRATETDSDIDSIRQRALSSLMNAVSSGSLETTLNSLSLTSKKQDDVGSMRLKALSRLEKAAASGELEEFVTPMMKTNEIGLEHMRQKTASSLVNAPESGIKSVPVPEATKDENEVLMDIRQRIAGSFVKAAKSDRLHNALNALHLREKLRLNLVQAAQNGCLELAVKETVKNSPAQNTEQIERIRQKAQASLEVFLKATP